MACLANDWPSLMNSVTMIASVGFDSCEIWLPKSEVPTGANRFCCTLPPIEVTRPWNDLLKLWPEA